MPSMLACAAQCRGCKRRQADGYPEVANERKRRDMTNAAAFAGVVGRECLGAGRSEM